MKVGLSLPNRGVLFGATTLDELLDLAVAADRSEAFDSVWTGDGLIAKPRVEMLVVLSAIAARTERVALGTACMATFALRNPVLFAAQWASLDVLSGGRTLLAPCLGSPTGRGGGDFEAELEAMGVQRKERVDRFEEGLMLLRRLWSGPTSHDGPFWHFPEIDLVPKPVQQPCPLWISSNPQRSKLSPERYRRAVERVAKLADGWLTTVVEPREFGERWREIKELAAQQGRDVGRMSSGIHLMINIQRDPKRAREEAEAFLNDYFMTKLPMHVVDAWGAYGTPEDVAARIQEYVDEGLDVPVLRFVSFDQKGQVELAAKELVPIIGHR